LPMDVARLRVDAPWDHGEAVSSADSSFER
jgi:hypothetical protein